MAVEPVLLKKPELIDPSGYHPLWGGAFAVRFPPGFYDSSDFRPIPDNQEVFVHGETDQSIILEFCEPPQAAVDPKSLAKVHLQAILGDNDAEDPQHSRIITGRALDAQHLPNLAPPEKFAAEYMATYLHAEMMVSKFKEQVRNWVTLFLVVIRLKRVNTDLVITFNNPVAIDPNSSSAGSLISPANAENVFVDFVKSLKVNDLSIFN